MRCKYDINSGWHAAFKLCILKFFRITKTFSIHNWLNLWMWNPWIWRSNTILFSSKSATHSAFPSYGVWLSMLTPLRRPWCFPLFPHIRWINIPCEYTSCIFLKTPPLLCSLWCSFVKDSITLLLDQRLSNPRVLRESPGKLMNMKPQA